MSALGSLKERDLEVGEELPPLAIGTITREQIAGYSRAAHDMNPMHTDEEFAKASGYPTVFAQGMLSMGFLARYLVELGGVGCVKKIGVRFKTMTWPGETIRCCGRVVEVSRSGGKRVVRCDIHTENEASEPKAIGSATLEL
jgi:acyl dehydratase